MLGCASVSGGAAPGGRPYDVVPGRARRCRYRSAHCPRIEYAYSSHNIFLYQSVVGVQQALEAIIGLGLLVEDVVGMRHDDIRPAYRAQVLHGLVDQLGPD